MLEPMVSIVLDKLQINHLSIHGTKILGCSMSLQTMERSMSGSAESRWEGPHRPSQFAF